MSAAASLAEAIRRSGPLPFDRFGAVALDAFFEQGGAGRAGGDFITSPEVGPLFGRLVARACDRWWHELGEPDPFVVVDAGAGDGRLAASVLRADLACRSALHLVLVERSERLRVHQRQRLALEPPTDALGPGRPGIDAHTGDELVLSEPGSGPIVTSLPELPASVPHGVVFANELLDNLPFGVVARRPDGGWDELRVGLAAGDASEAEHFVEVYVPAPPEVAARFADVDVPPGTVLPDPVGIDEWLTSVARTLPHGRVTVVDYAATTEELVARGRGWLRTYRDHERGDDPLRDPGRWDVTADVWRERFEHAARRAGLEVRRTLAQAEWLRELGIDELVEAGRRDWESRAAAGDLVAIEGRSRALEAGALLDPSGLGGHVVFELAAPA